MGWGQSSHVPRLPIISLVPRRLGTRLTSGVAMEGSLNLRNCFADLKVQAQEGKKRNERMLAMHATCTYVWPMSDTKLK